MEGSGRGRPWWRIAEPTTTLTDLLLAAVGIAAAVPLLRRAAAEGEAAMLLWGLGMLAVAASALLGAAFHGAAPWLSARRADALWLATLAAIGATDFLLVAAVVVAELGGAARALLLAAAAAKLLLYLRRIRRDRGFRAAAVDGGAALLGVAAVEGIAWAAGRAPGADWILAGVLLSLVGAAIQATGRGVHRHLNHNDLFHLVQVAAVYLFYRGGLLLG